MTNLLKITFLCTCLTFASCFGFRNLSMKQKADQLSKEKEYDKAISAYWEHIKNRERVPNRPEWENPYIYLLDIGDTYLEMNNVEEALKTYELAASHQVKDGYVNDRLRNIATWHENRGELDKAIEHLQKYRERDELLFDLMLNRLARKLVAEEEKAEKEAEATSTSTDGTVLKPTTQ